MKADDKEVENIRVAVRCRPMNDREKREQAVSCFTCGPNGLAILTNIENPAEKYEFGFDFVYGCDSKQESVFDDIGIPLLDRAFGGYNGTIFAYGQTGSGKSYSMTGITGELDTLEGLIPRVNRAIFERVAKERVECPNKLFLVECSYFEIYNEIIYDLLDCSGTNKKNRGGLEIKEHSVLGIYVKDLQERVVERREEIVELMTLGAQSRTVGYTQMNSESSRSHSIFTIKIHQKDAEDETKNIFAKINLVDLAGSERAATTGAHGDRLREGANINKSLSALGNVINALVEASRVSKKVFIPYRNSKLTRVLQESLGGNSLCSMIAALSPASINFSETLSTLKYASRAKSIKVNAKKNEALSQISLLTEEIAALKQKLLEQMETTVGLDPKEKDELVIKYEKQIQEMDRVRLQTWEDKAKLSRQHEMERKKLARERALADQRIREERTKKWQLLEEKGDLELMIRGLHDLVSSNAAMTDGTATLVVKQWLDTAQRIKTMEGEARDLRTLIQVFRDSLQSDVELWAKRYRLAQDVNKSPKNLSSQCRDDSATASAVLITASQIVSKLQNIRDESEKLLTVEDQLVSDRSALINMMTRELFRFRAHIVNLNAYQGAGTTGPTGKLSPLAAEEAKQLLDERLRGLTITLALVRNQRSAHVLSIKNDRQKIFNLAAVYKYFLSYADQHFVNTITEAPEVAQQLARWEAARTKLLAASETWEDSWTESLSGNNLFVVEYEGDREPAALGLETRAVPDECITASSMAQDAKFARLNGPRCWSPDVHDEMPSLVIDFEIPHIFDSISVRGGRVELNSSFEPSDEMQTLFPSPSTASTFVLASTADLQSARARYKLDEVNGMNDLIYELLANVMSWPDLLKTDVIPVKLFSRPPVRFLHDVISTVMRNTGFAIDAISTIQLDYAQLPTKTERAEYLSVVLNYVQAWYKRQQHTSEDFPSVIIAATASNILAGKEPTDTIQFLIYFVLAAMDHAIQNPPAPRAVEKRNVGVIASDVKLEQESKANVDILHNCWVTRLRVATSLTDNPHEWRFLGEFNANTDTGGTVSISLADGSTNDGNRAGRFLQLSCIEWHQRAALQCEVFGREAHENMFLTQNIEAVAAKARKLLEQVRYCAALILEDGRALYERAKAAESEKYAQLSSCGEELARLKAACAAWEKKQRDMQELQAHLTAELEAANRRADWEKTRVDELQGKLIQATSLEEERKRRGDLLQTQLCENEHQIQALSMQVGDQKRAHEALLQTKKQLEILIDNLRGQLIYKKQEEAASLQEHTQIAGLNGEIMSLRVQLDEQYRELEAAKLQFKEQEALGRQHYLLLQQTRATLLEKEAGANAKLKAHVAESEVTIGALHKKFDCAKHELERALAAENLLKLAAGRLETECGTLRTELDIWRQRAAVAEARIQGHAEISVAFNAQSSGENSRNAETEAAAQDNGRFLMEAQTKDLRRLADLEKTEAMVTSLGKKLALIEEKAHQAERALVESTRRVKELEEIEDEMHQQLDIVTEERDSARQKEEQLFAEMNEKDQEIERIRDGYVWVTDRMNSKEDELNELQEQLERYQSILAMTGAKSESGRTFVSARHTENKPGAEITKLYKSVIGTTNSIHAETDMMIKTSTADTQPSTTCNSESLAASVSSQTAMDNTILKFPKPINDGISGEEETDYDDDFDDADDNGSARMTQVLSKQV